jgi:hypothetical protein
VDFLLTAHRDQAAARPFFRRAMDLHDVPKGITIDKSGANTSAVRGLLADSGATTELRQSKYLNNVVEQDHRVVKRRVRPMLGFKTFATATSLIAGIETMHMIKKGQLRCPGGLAFSAADYFYSLASSSHDGMCLSRQIRPRCAVRDPRVEAVVTGWLLLVHRVVPERRAGSAAPCGRSRTFP